MAGPILSPTASSSKQARRANPTHVLSPRPDTSDAAKNVIFRSGLAISARRLGRPRCANASSSDSGCYLLSCQP